jgi:hypothetical protein
MNSGASTDQVDTMTSPGAVMSGFRLPSRAGPRLEKEDIWPTVGFGGKLYVWPSMLSQLALVV